MSDTKASPRSNAGSGLRSPRGVLARRVAAATFIAILASCAIYARRSGIDADAIHRELLSLGWIAAPLFLVLMTAGELVHLPGLAFVVAARLVFGPSAGFALGYLGAVLAVTTSFVVARQLLSAARATDEPWRPRWRFLQRAFDRLESQPVLTIALLRLVLVLASPLSYALAASRVRLRDHLLGSALGLFAPVLIVVLLGGYL